MRRLLPLAVAVLFLPAFGSLHAQPGKDDAKKIQGTWIVAAFEMGGKKEAPPVELKLKFGPDKIEGFGDDRPVPYKLGVEKGLGTIDMTPAEGPDKGKTGKGIYELKDYELKICLPDDITAERPKEFTSRGGYGIIYLKRDKP
jgi:uncharacterized protein (TIGR03067 family)